MVVPSYLYDGSMLNWLKGRVTQAPIAVTPDPKAAKRHAGMDRKYLALHTYLDNRYANTVCLSFQQIEDLLGFALPDRARTDLGWWTPSPAETEGRYSQAWMQAEMTARPNLFAQNVVFERAP